MDRPEAVNELKATWAILNADLDAAVAYGKASNTPYAQRALVRSFFAAVEGLSFLLRQVTVASLTDTHLLQQDELALLRETSFSLDDQGRPKTKTSHLQFPASLLFSVRMYARNHGANFELDTSGKGWQAFQVASKARNRITHPKSSTSLNLTESELKALIEASHWWESSMLALFTACEEADRYWQQRKEDLIDK